MLRLYEWLYLHQQWLYATSSVIDFEQEAGMGTTIAVSWRNSCHQMLVQLGSASSFQALVSPALHLLWTVPLLLALIFNERLHREKLSSRILSHIEMKCLPNPLQGPVGQADMPCKMDLNFPLRLLQPPGILQLILPNPCLWACTVHLEAFTPLLLLKH